MDVDFVNADGVELLVLVLKLVDVRLAAAVKVAMIMTNASNRFIASQVKERRRFFVKLIINMLRCDSWLAGF